MRSPLQGFRKLFLAVREAILSAYAVASKEPELVFDFAEDYYRTSGSDATFADSITHARASNATMVDSDGVLKWAPHNLLTYSEDFSQTYWTQYGLPGTWDSNLVISTGHPDPFGGAGATLLTESAATGRFYLGAGTTWNSFTVGVGVRHTRSIWVKSNGMRYVSWGTASDDSVGGKCICLFDLDTGSLVQSLIGASATLHSGTATSAGSGWYLLQVDATIDAAHSFAHLAFHETSTMAWGTSVRYQIPSYAGDGTSGIYVWGAHLYRSDLGGMVNNPDRGDSYVPTTTAARYLPRRGHHVYNGDSWVDKGVLVESEARTNLALYSNDFSNAAWTKSGCTVAQDVVGTDGANSGWTHTATSTSARSEQSFTVATSASYVYSVYAKAGTTDFLYIVPVLFTTPSNSSGVWFDLTNGVVGTQQNASEVVGLIEDAGGGWYRCIIHILSTDAADTSGVIRNNIVSANGFTTCLVGDSVSLYGAQLEAASTPSSYIPTSGSTVTRAADSLTVPSANLPWPTPEVIGEELVTNGTFDSDTDWTKSSFVISGGEATASPLTTYNYIYQNIGVESGKTYLITATFSDMQEGLQSSRYFMNLGDFATQLENNRSFASVGITGNGTFSVVVTAIGSSGNIMFGSWLSRPLTIDNISVKEINPLALSIQMDGEMTYADTNVAVEVSFLQWWADGFNFIEQELNTGGVKSGNVYFSQIALGVSDGVGYNGADNYTPGTNVPFNIASRHGSTFINGAVDGTALTADTTPTALPDLSATDLNLAYDYMGTIKTFRIWADDLGDEGIEEASAPSVVPSLSLTFDGASTSFTDTGMTV